MCIRDSGNTADLDFDGFSFAGRVYFDTVDTSQGPLVEAAFLDKSSSVGLSFERIEPDISGAPSADTTTLDLRFVGQSDFILEIGIEKLDNELFDFEETTLSAGVGIYLNDNTDLIFTLSTFDEADANQLQLEAHSLVSLRGDSAFSYDLGIAYFDADGFSSTELNIAMNYFFNTQFSIGANYDLSNGDGLDESTLGFGADWFITPNFRMAFAYTMEEIEVEVEDFDGDFEIETDGFSIAIGGLSLIHI